MTTTARPVLALLKSIETGEADAVSLITPTQYTQHNLGAADGLTGFGALLQALPLGSVRVNTLRIFRDGDFLFAHTEDGVVGSTIGFDIFRFESGQIVEHRDTIEAIPPRATWKNENGTFGCQRRTA